MADVKATLTADIGPLKAKMAEASAAVKAFGSQTTTVDQHLKTFGNTFSGQQLIARANATARSIAEIGGAAKLTDREMQSATRTIDAALQKFKRLGQDAPADLQKINAELKALQTESAKVAAPAQGGGGRGSFLAGIAGGATALALSAVAAGLRDIVSEAARLTPLAQSFERLQGGSQQAERAIAGLREATRGLVSDADLMQAANKGSLLGLDAMGIKFEEVASVATVLGRAMGQDAAKSVDDLTTALARQSPQILDNLGIKVNLTSATEAYARSLGKSADALTEDERKFAFATAAMEAAREKAAQLGEVTLTATEQVTRFTTALKDAGTRLLSAGNESSLLAAALESLNDTLTDLNESFTGVVDKAADAAGGFGLLTAAFSDGATAGDRLGQSLKFVVAPGLNAVALSLRGMEATLDKVRALQGWFTGGSDVTNLPGRTSDIALPDTTFGQAGRARTWLAEEEARLQKQYMEDQDKALKAIGASMAATAAKAAKDAEKIAKAAKDNLKAAQEMTRGLQIGVNQNLTGTFGRTGLAGIEPNLNPFRSDGGALLAGGEPLSQQIWWLQSAVTPMQKAKAAATDWRVEMRGVVQAFASLAQIAGPSLDGVTRGLGTVLASGDAAFQMTQALAKQFSALGNGKDGLSTSGKGVAGGLAGLTTGLALGSMMTSKTGGFVAGAAGGAASGAMAGGAVGAGVGAVVGAFSGLYAANKNAKAQRDAIDQMRKDTIASYGTVEDFRRVVERAGYSYDHFLQAFNSSNPKTFTRIMNELNAALAEQKKRADALVKGLGEVARVQGVISQQQLAQIRNMQAGDPGSEDVLAFMAGQRQQAETGLVQAVAALEAYGTGALTDFSLGAQAAASGLYVAFTEALAQGESAISVLQRLGGAIQTLGGLGVGGEGFDQLKAMQGLVGGAQTGPAVQLAQGLGQALAGFANTGLLSPALFNELANGIGQAYQKILDLGGAADTSAALFQPYLQTIDKLIRDNPSLEAGLDDTTRALLASARASGLVGAQFDPAIDRAVAGIERLIAKLDEWLAKLAEASGMTFPTPTFPSPTTPAPAQPGPGDTGTPPANGGDYTTPLAVGGIVTRPTRALIGEAGPEAVIPLSKLWQGQSRTTQHISVMLDGRVLTRTVVKNLPSTVSVWGAA